MPSSSTNESMNRPVDQGSARGGVGAPVPWPGRALLVVAHPDDEILWFGSVLERMTTVVVCFLDYDAVPWLGESRRRALAEHPLDSLHCLGRGEAGSLDRADWALPRLETAGLRLGAGEARVRYRRNAAWLARRLPSLIDGHDVIFGHGPWGEYGHEDHVQLHAVLHRACRTAGLDFWVPACCGPKALPLARRYRLRPGSPRLRLSVDQGLARQIYQVYQRHDCWTWHDTWRWPEEEIFLRSADLERLPPRAARGERWPAHVEPMDYRTPREETP